MLVKTQQHFMEDLKADNVRRAWALGWAVQSACQVVLTWIKEASRHLLVQMIAREILAVVLGIVVPCLFVWQGDYRARYSFVLRVRRDGRRGVLGF